MFCLAHKINGHKIWVCGFVGQYQGLGWAGKHIYSNLSKKNPFCLGDKPVARSHNDISRFAGEMTMGHCYYCMSSTHHHEDIRLTE